MSLLVLVLSCLAVCCLIMGGVWLWAKKINNAGVVDVFWALNFPVIAIILLCLGNGWELRKILICGMVVIAGLRLGIHLWKRVIGHLDEEEGRYKQLRQDWAPNEDARFFWFFQFQAISNVVLAAPFFLIVLNTGTRLNWLEWLAFFIWALSITGESIADAQLSRFKKDSESKGEVCELGLWNYSRHPNYFFQCLMWTAYFLFALSAPWGWTAIISPAIIIYLILNVTGIPATEEQALRSKGDKYRRYQQTTSVLIPWFKKK